MPSNLWTNRLSSKSMAPIFRTVCFRPLSICPSLNSFICSIFQPKLSHFVATVLSVLVNLSCRWLTCSLLHETDDWHQLKCRRHKPLEKSEGMFPRIILKLRDSKMNVTDPPGYMFSKKKRESILEKVKMPRILRVTKVFLNLYPTALQCSIIKNAQYTMTSGLLSSYNLDTWDKDSQVSVTF